MVLLSVPVYLADITQTRSRAKSTARIPQNAILLIFFIIAFFRLFRKGENTVFEKKALNRTKKSRKTRLSAVLYFQSGSGYTPEAIMSAKAPFRASIVNT